MDSTIDNISTRRRLSSYISDTGSSSEIMTTTAAGEISLADNDASSETDSAQSFEIKKKVPNPCLAQKMPYDLQTIHSNIDSDNDNQYRQIQ